MTSIDAPTHPLSLKVMRVSRPEPASAWQPFYSSSPSFSAHSSASVLSLQGSAPLTGHPKTLRDLTHASELLTLPATFGSIQLGETFSSCLCINNGASVEIDDVGLKVEIQTASSKLLLLELGGRDHQLGVGGSLESIVSHEIKELGQHVLACTVAYRLPPGARAVPGASEEESGDPGLQTFRKFYKFVVVNPLSVKTKVHSSRSPSALLDLSERDKVFLEIHIQNTGQHPLHFEQLQFESEESWQVEDGNVMRVDEGNGREEEESLLSGSLILIHPQDTRQYVYILSPKVVSLFPVTYSPGSVIPLGRLNISWRSSFGEPGRLLTSMLSRRIPLAAPQQTAPALPAYLKRTITGHPSRPQSPLLAHSRPSSPSPQRPTSPPPAALPRPTPQMLASGIELALLVRHVPRNNIVLEKPFTVKLALAISNLGPGGRVIKIAVQQLQPARAVPLASTESNADVLSPRPSSSGMNTPTSTVGGFNYAVAHQKLLSISRASVADESDKQQESVANSKHDQLPPPYFDTTDKAGSIAMTYVGPSTVMFPEITMGTGIMDESDNDGAKPSFVQEFDLTYIPLRKGFVTFGGIRALLIEDRFISAAGRQDGDQTPILKSGHEKKVQALREWDIVGEVWVAT